MSNILVLMIKTSIQNVSCNLQSAEGQKNMFKYILTFNIKTLDINIWHQVYAYNNITYTKMRIKQIVATGSKQEKSCLGSFSAD